MDFAEKIYPSPCNEKGLCLVKASCTLVNRMPWERDQCPDYLKWKKKTGRVNWVLDTISFSLNVCLCVIIVLIPVCIFGLGLWKGFELIKGWFF